MVMWLTKYALSEGIFKIEGIYTSDGVHFSGKRVCGIGTFFVNKKEVFASKDDAERDFYARRAKKIASLEKQITKLEKAKAKFIE